MDDFFFDDVSNHADDKQNDNNDIDMLGDENPLENPVLNQENLANDDGNKSLFGDFDDEFDDNLNDNLNDAKQNDEKTGGDNAGIGSQNDTLSERKAKKQKLQEELANEKELQRRKRLELQEEENKKMQVLMGNFSEEQLNRYEVFRRAAFTKSNIKKIIQTICGKSVSASVVIAMSGIAKVFVGEIVEQALDVKEKFNEKGPLQPKHLREAYRLFKKSNKLASPCKYKKPPLF
jgi:transcription initiation factor TFIID subunit 11